MSLPGRDSVLAILREMETPLSMREIAHMLHLGKTDKGELRALLKEMESDGTIQQTGGKTWRLPPARKRAPNALRGMLQVTRRGFGFVRLDGSSAEAAGVNDVFISEEDLGPALEGDTVLVRITGNDDRGARGRIAEVVDRRHKTIVGRWQRTFPRGGIVVPRNPLVQRRIRVALPDPALKVENFEWVAVEITEYTRHPEDLLGRIVERIGAGHEQGIDVLLLLRDKGIVAEFPATVEHAAAALKMDTKAEMPRRTDLRGLPVCTIDPATAKDFDDALSIEPEPGGGWRLWVHIADVSHFVRPDDPIDREARDRSTSVYPVDRVVPMLPEKLSNDLCSLRPNEDRFTMTAEMVVSPAGKIEHADFCSSIIHSRRRFAYEEVQAIYDDAPSAPKDVDSVMRQQVFLLRDCSRAMRAARMRRGALDLDIPEVEVVFHADGAVSHLELSDRFEAHWVVEDCMLAANEAVADFLTRRKAPLLYRVHEQADPDRLERLIPVLKALGVNLSMSKKDGTITPQDLQAALRSIAHREAGHILRRMILRALKRAEYWPVNGGHFGLASKCYCHFTSPIRRYPDVVAHRQLRAVERAEPLVWSADADGMAELKELGRHTSWREREAQDAEMESNRIKAIEFIKKQEGEEFDGYVAGVQAFGMFVELIPSGVEGIVPIRAMRDDRYDIDDLGIALVGRSTGRRYRLTDKVRVRIAKALPFEGELELEIVPREGDDAPMRQGPPRRSGHANPKSYRPPTNKTLKRITKKRR